MTIKLFAKSAVAVVLFVAVAGGSGIVGDAVGFDVTPQSQTCSIGGHGGGS